MTALCLTRPVSISWSHYIYIYIVLCSTDSHRSVSLKVLEGNNCLNIKNVKIQSRHSIYENACKLPRHIFVKGFLV